MQIVYWGASIALIQCARMRVPTGLRRMMTIGYATIRYTRHFRRVCLVVWAIHCATISASSTTLMHLPIVHVWVRYFKWAFNFN